MLIPPSRAQLSRPTVAPYTDPIFFSLYPILTRDGVEFRVYFRKGESRKSGTDVVTEERKR